MIAKIFNTYSYIINAEAFRIEEASKEGESFSISPELLEMKLVIMRIALSVMSSLRLVVS